MKLMRFTLKILSLYCFKLSKGDHTFCLIHVWHSLTAFFKTMLYILKHKNVKKKKKKKSLLLHNCKNSLILKILFHFPRIFSPSGPFLTHTCQQSHSSKVHISSSIDQRTFIPHIHRPDWLTPTEPSEPTHGGRWRDDPPLSFKLWQHLLLLYFLSLFLSFFHLSGVVTTHRFVQKKEKATSSLT